MDSRPTMTKSSDTIIDRIGGVAPYAILTGAVLAAIGNHIVKKRRRESQEALNNPMKGNDSIVIPVDKGAFMSRLMTPEALAESRGEMLHPEPVVETPALEYAEPAPEPQLASDAGAMSPEELKRSILRSHGIRLNMFKHAGESMEEDESNSGFSSSDPESLLDRKDESGGKEEEGDKEEDEEVRALPPRDQLGRFVSPEDPLAVEMPEGDEGEYEKTAQDSFLDGLANAVFHPFDSLGKAWERGTQDPLLAISGIVIGTGVASKILSKVNARRLKKANKDLEAARNAYMSTIIEHGSEKKADDDGFGWKNPTVLAGLVAGGMITFPLAISAMLVNRVLQNREEEKKKRALAADNYPKDPAMLFTPVDVGATPRPQGYLAKDASGERKVSLASVAMAAMVKSAMYDWTDGMEKSAKPAAGGSHYGGWGAFAADPWDAPGAYLAQLKLERGERLTDKELNNLLDYDGLRESDRNKLLLMKRLRGLGDNYGEAAKVLTSSSLFRKNIANSMPDPGASTPDGSRPRIDLSNNPDLKILRAQMGEKAFTSMMDHANFNEGIVNAFEEDEDLRKVRSNYINSSIGTGWLAKVIQWLAEVTGLGKYFFNRTVRNEMARANKYVKLIDHSKPPQERIDYRKNSQAYDDAKKRVRETMEARKQGRIPPAPAPASNPASASTPAPASGRGQAGAGGISNPATSAKRSFGSPSNPRTIEDFIMGDGKYNGSVA